MSIDGEKNFQGSVSDTLMCADAHSTSEQPIDVTAATAMECDITDMQSQDQDAKPYGCGMKPMIVYV